MKRTFLFWLFSAMLTYGYAVDEVALTIMSDNNTNGAEVRRTPAVLPSVSYEDNVIGVACSYSIDHLQVIVRDEQGDIVYSSVGSLVAPGQLYTLTADESSRKHSIELIWDDMHLIGYF